MISAPTPKMYTIPVGAAVPGGPPDRPTHPAGAAPYAASRAAEDIRPYIVIAYGDATFPLWVEGLVGGPVWPSLRGRGGAAPGTHL